MVDFWSIFKAFFTLYIQLEMYNRLCYASTFMSVVKRCITVTGRHGSINKKKVDFTTATHYCDIQTCWAQNDPEIERIILVCNLQNCNFVTLVQKKSNFTPPCIFEFYHATSRIG